VANFHSTAVVNSGAEIAPDVTMGPFCVIEADVVIEAGCQLASHVVIKRGTHLGPNNQICEGAVLGGKPQHLRAGERVGRLRVGCGNMIRENVTIHCGLHEEDVTTVGDHNMIMVNAHIAHDCHVGDHVILANNVMIAGHVTIESRAYLSGASGVHQFCRVGQLAMVGGQARLTQDVPPFVMIDGGSTHVVGLNRIGLQRNGYSREEIHQLKSAYRLIYRSGLTWTELLEQLQAEFPSGPAAAYYEFFRDVKRGFVRERRAPQKSTLRIFAEEHEDGQSAAVRSAS
jgi:UDP-N-acetylglucosamine acyltransferase